MIHEIHEISFRGHVARLATYFLDNSPEIDSGRIRPVAVSYTHLQRHGWIFRSG